MAPYVQQLNEMSALYGHQEAAGARMPADETSEHLAAAGSAVASVPQVNNANQEYGGEVQEEEDEDAPVIEKYKRESWDIMFQRLLKYKAEHGDCSVPQDYRGIPKLGNWVQKQRTLKKSNRLLPDRVERLDVVGFTWRVQESWDFMFQKLVEYKEQNGDCDVPKHYSPDRKLGKWVRVQRMRRKILTADRLERLNSIGFK